MLTDRYGLPLSTASAEARDAYVAGCDKLLSAVAGVEADLERAVAADPGFALGHAALARAHFVKANVTAARQSAAKARELSVKASAREWGHVNALCLGIEGDPAGSFQAIQAHVRDWPRDAMVVAPATGVFGLIGFSGRPGREPEQFEFLHALAPHYGDDWWFLCVYAFALGEHGRLVEARAAIERSMMLEPRNAHGAHIKVHVLYELGEDREAAAYLDEWMPGFDKAGLLHCHLSWHVALAALSLGDMEKAWRVYAADIHPGGSWGPYLNSVTDTVSFLWRAELSGHARRAELWAQLHEHAQKSFPKAGIAFADVHCALACIAAGDEARLAQVIAEVEEKVAAGRYPAGSVVSALARGLAAYEKQDWSGAIAILEGALAETVRIGGSRAQRDLVEYTLLAALLKDGRAGAAKEMIERRTHRRPAVPVRGFH